MIIAEASFGEILGLSLGIAQLLAMIGGALAIMRKVGRHEATLEGKIASVKVASSRNEQDIAAVSKLVNELLLITTRLGMTDTGQGDHLRDLEKRIRSLEADLHRRNGSDPRAS